MDHEWIIFGEIRDGFQLCTCSCGEQRWTSRANIVRNLSRGCGGRYGLPIKIQCDCGKQRTRKAKLCADCSRKRVRSPIRLALMHLSDAIYTRVYRLVHGAIGRCAGKHPNYGGRGIEVRFATRMDFVIYLATLPGHDDFSLVLDREDCNGHYEPGNIRFVTRLESSHNTRKRCTYVSTTRRTDLAAIRLAVGLSQAALALLLNVSRSYINMVEAGLTADSDKMREVLTYYEELRCKVGKVGGI